MEIYYLERNIPGHSCVGYGIDPDSLGAESLIEKIESVPFELSPGFPSYQIHYKSGEIDFLEGGIFTCKMREVKQ